MILSAVTTTTLVQRAGAYSSELTDSPVTGYTTDDNTAPTDAPVTVDTTDATPSPVTDDHQFIDECTPNDVACAADATCTSCVTAGSDSAAELECRQFSLLTSTAEGCDANLDYACCLDDLSEFECLDNDAFMALFICSLGEYNCVVDEITCDGDESTTEFDGAAAKLGPASTALAFSTALTALLPFLAVGLTNTLE